MWESCKLLYTQKKEMKLERQKFVTQMFCFFFKNEFRRNRNYSYEIKNNKIFLFFSVFRVSVQVVLARRWNHPWKFWGVLGFRGLGSGVCRPASRFSMFSRPSRQTDSGGPCRQWKRSRPERIQTYVANIFWKATNLCGFNFIGDSDIHSSPKIFFNRSDFGFVFIKLGFREHLFSSNRVFEFEKRTLNPGASFLKCGPSSETIIVTIEIIFIFII